MDGIRHLTNIYLIVINAEANTKTIKQLKTLKHTWFLVYPDREDLPSQFRV